MDRYVAMQAFIRVINTGSFSSASRQLGVGQPAISKMVAQLESRLGLRLLFRSTRNVVPTDAGWKFYEHAKRSVEEADEAEFAARGAAETLTGRLRVQATMAFAQMNVIPRLPEFLAQYPALDVDIIIDDQKLDLIRCGIDLGLRSGQLKDSSTLVAHKIAQCKRIVVGTSSYFRTAGVPRTPTDFATHQVILYDEPLGGKAWTFRRGSAKARVDVGGRVRLNAAHGVRECVLANLGLTIASEWMFQTELKSNAVELALADWSLPPVEAWAIFPVGRQISAKARTFAAFIARRMLDADTEAARSASLIAPIGDRDHS